MKLLDVKNYEMKNTGKAIECDVESVINVLNSLGDVSVIDVSSSQEMKAIITLIKLKGFDSDSLIVFNKLKEFEDVEDDSIVYVTLRNLGRTQRSEAQDESFKIAEEIIMSDDTKDTVLGNTSTDLNVTDIVENEVELDEEVEEELVIEEDILIEDEEILPSEKYPGYYYKTSTREIMVNTGTCFEVYQPVTYE